MTFFKMAAATALLTLVPMTAMAAEMPSAEQCSAWFAKADKNSDGSLGGSGEEAAKYGDLRSGGSSQAQSTDGGASGGGSGNNNLDFIMTKEVFLETCRKGSFGMPTN